MNAFDDVKNILIDILSLDSRTVKLDRRTALLGEIPEFDSMAVISVITAIEEQFDVIVEDDEIDADTFETIGSLCEFLESKVNG